MSLIRKHPSIDWETCCPSLVVRHEEVLRDLIAKQLAEDGEAASALELKKLDLRAEAIVQAEVDDERVESEISAAMTDRAFA